MNHDEFMEEVAKASSLPAQNKKALGPVTTEDDAVYTEGEENGN